MTVSVLLPTYNQSAFLLDALAGLSAQTFRDFEVIVCDDGSTDSTPDLLRAVRDRVTRVVRHEANRGAAEAINTAARHATGELMTWVSSDNVMRPEWLAMLWLKLKDHPGLGAVYSSYRQHENGKGRDVFPGPYRPDRLIESENCHFGPSFLIRREVWPEHRGQSSHDYDHWARVEEACWARGLSIDYVGMVLCDYYAGPWCTARARPDLYDAPKWQAEAKRRRATGSASSSPPACAPATPS